MVQPMKIRVWKYEIRDEPGVSQIIKVPLDAQILTVKLLKGSPVIYAQVDPNKERMVEIRVEIIGTGKPAEHVESMQYLGTYIIDDYVGHVYVSTTRAYGF